MKRFSIERRNRGRLRKALALIVMILLIGGVGAAFTVRHIYNDKLLPVNSAAHEEIVATIPSGSSLSDIADILLQAKLIRADWAFEQYIRSQELTDKLKAGTYRLNTDQSVQAIVKDLVAGKVAVDLFTILPGQRLDQIRTAFIDGGFTAGDVDEALDPSNYANHSALVDKPVGASLEGYLYPDSFQKTAETKPATIVTASLDEMAENLTPAIRSGIAAQGLNVYQGIIIASIVEKEIPSSNPDDRAKAAQVFLKRFKIGMQLGSDVTACYGALRDDVVKAGTKCDDYVAYDSPYNTRIHDGLPPTPISNVTKSGLSVIAHPANTDYLFFVAGADCTTRFSSTNEEHDALVAKYGLSTNSNSCK